MCVIAAGMLSMCAMAQRQGLALTIGYGQPTMREGLNSDLTSGEVFNSLGMGEFGIGNTVRYKGMHVGMMYEAQIIKGFGAAVSLNYCGGWNSTDWHKDETAYSDFPRSRVKMEMHSLDLAFDWQYKFELAGQTYIILYTGPSIGVNVGGKTQLFYEPGRNTTYEFDQDPFRDDDIVLYEGETGGYSSMAFRRYNVRWGLGAGFQYKRYFIRGGYDFGLINAYRNSQVDIDGDVYNIKSRLDQWQIKLGIFFWQKD